MTLIDRLNALATAIGNDVKALRLADGDLTSLSTKSQDNLVNAINELYGMLGNYLTGDAMIAYVGDNKKLNTTNKTTLVDAINEILSTASSTTYTDTAINKLRDELRAGAGAALDTFAEVAAQLANDESGTAALATAVGNRVRYDDVQTLTEAQKAQARNNIGALSTVEVGDPDTDLVSVYNSAKEPALTTAQ